MILSAMFYQDKHSVNSDPHNIIPISFSMHRALYENYS